MRASGFRIRVRVVGVDHIAADRRPLSLPFSVRACHHAHFLRDERYIIIGDVPPSRVHELLSRRPAIEGLIQSEPDPQHSTETTTWSFGGPDGAKRWSAGAPGSM